MMINEYGFDCEKIVANGNKFLLSNGYLGYRGTLDEFSAEQCVGLNVASFYDGVSGKWRETVNAFNPFYLIADVCGKKLDVREGFESHQLQLDIHNGLLLRETQFCVDGANITLQCERFVSLNRRNLLCSRLKLISDKNVCVTILAGVDERVWDLNGPHLINKRPTFENNISKVSATAQESNLPVVVCCEFSVTPQQTVGSIGRFDVQLKANETFVLDRVAHVLCGESPCCVTYDEARGNHIDSWHDAWKNCGVQIEGNERANLALQYSVFQLIGLAPKGNYSIAARGLSGQTYKGAVFWDTEIYLFPFYLHTMPSVAKKLAQYRVDTLPQAKLKAQSYGYGGAFYAWESQNGVDACSDFNVVDVFTHRPVRTYFKDKQIHISADVAYCLLQYFRHTQDVDFMLEGGLQTVLECAEFARQYSYFNHNKNRYELLDVIGPDEYHERVNNNAFTNYTFYFVTVEAVRVARRLQRSLPQRFAQLKNLPNISRLYSWAKKLYLPQPDENGVIPQFDGYFQLEDVSVEEVRTRLVQPNEYWGGSTGVATATRVIKQADVIALFNLFPDRFPLDVQKANYNFYLPYTEHGSSLSQCAYALTACRIGDGDGAYKAFLNAAEIDLLGGGKQWAGEIYIGGTHPAASGGAWQAAVLGFGGLTCKGKLCVSPHLPKQISKLLFNVSDGLVQFEVTNKKVVKHKL